MFSKLKKLVSKDEEKRADAANGDGGGFTKTESARNSNGMRSLEPQLQKKFGRGVHYNMKILIRGERNVGKSCLLLRLQGGNFKDDYVPSDEIQVANITWNFKTMDDVVKVELWDVVDKGKKKKALSGLKVHNTPQNGDDNADAEVGLDAETLDVYKGAHGMILMMDWTKPWTFDYVKHELSRVPQSLPILLLINFRDLEKNSASHGAVVTLGEVRSYVHYMERPKSAAPILIAESSMKNGFGLKYMHRFFNLPFLQLQRENLQRQVAQNRHDMELTFKELESLLESEEQNYDRFMHVLMHGPSKSRYSLGESVPVPAAAGDHKNDVANRKQASLPEPESPEIEQPTHTFEKVNIVPTDIRRSSKTSGSNVKVRTVDDFVPDDSLEGEFLNEHPTHVASRTPVRSGPTVDDSDDENGGNPMVSGFEDEIELDLDDTAVISKFVSTLPPARVEAEPDTKDKKRPSYPAETSLPRTPPEALDNEQHEHGTYDRQPDEGAEQEAELERTSSVTEEPLEPSLPPVLSEALPPAPALIQLSSQELSSWLQDVEERASAPKVEQNHEVTADVEEEPVVRKKKKEKSTKEKKEKSGKSGKAKPEKEPKATKSSAKEDAAPVSSPALKAPKRASVSDELSMEKELEEFLASD